MRRIAIAVMLAVLLLIAMPTTVSAASGVQIVDKTGDGEWTDDTWKVDIYPGEVKSTILNLYNSSSSSLDVEVSIIPDSLDNGNLTFELDKSTFTMPGGSYNNVTLSVTASGSATPGTYTTELELKVEVIYPPSVATIIASPVGSYWAVLRGTLTDMGTASSVDVNFEWGETTAYGSMTAARTMNRPGAFWATITGLTPNTTYHFRPVAVGDDTSYGSDRSFTTISPPPPGPPRPPPIPPAPPGTTDVRGMVTTAGVFLEPVTATSEDELCTLTIPEGTVGLTEELEPLSEITVVIIDEPPAPPEDAHIIGLAYDFDPAGATFDPPLTLEYSYDPEALPEGVAEEDLVLAYYDEATGEWVVLEGCVIDTENNTITASIAHFTTFAIIGVVPVVTPPAPAAFSVSSLSIQPAEVEPAEAVTITVSVANTGGESGSYTVVLKIDGVKESEKRVTVAAGSSQTVSFSVTREEADSYTVTVDGLSGSFTVAPVVVPPEPAAFSVSFLSVSPEVEPAETITITVFVANTGGESGSYTVVLKIDGVKEAEETVTVAAGDSQEVSFSVTREEAGSYTVTVDGLSGSFTVVALPPGVNWPLIGGIIAGVVVVGLLTFFLVRRRAA